MSNPTNASGDSATPNPDPGATPNPTPSGATPQGMTLEQALAELAKTQETLAATRKESIQHRTKLTAFEKKQEEEAAAKLDETQRAAKRAEDAEAKAAELQQKYLASQVKLAAQTLGFVNPELAAKLVSVDPDATPESISDALAALLKDNPYLASGTVTPAPSSNGPTNPSRAQVGLPKYTAAQLSDTDFYIKNEADIKLAMRDGRILN
jgi:hypothetical protein